MQCADFFSVNTPKMHLESEFTMNQLVGNLLSDLRINHHCKCDVYVNQRTPHMSAQSNTREHTNLAAREMLACERVCVICARMFICD